MTQMEWLDCAEPQRMLSFMHRLTGDRTLRLLSCAFCRQVWHLLTEDGARRAVEVAERFADGEASEADLQRAAFGPPPLTQTVPADSLVLAEHRTAIACACAIKKRPTPDRASFYAAGAYSRWGDSETVSALALQAGAVRDLFNPFRPAVLDPRWHTSEVVGLARAIYEDRVFDRLPLLADALMDAGCEEEQIIGHCRADGPHYRGCWVVDLVLSRE